MHELAQEHKRYGYRRITRLLRREGWQVNHKKVHRLWRLEGLKVPKKRKKKRIYGTSSASITKQKATRPNDVWSYDFLFDVTHKGQVLKIMPIIDEFTRCCLALVVATSIKASDVVKELEKLFEVHGIPEYIRSDNGPEYISSKVGKCLERSGSKSLFIEPGCPWENGIVESFNARLRDEVLDREDFWSVLECRAVLEDFRLFYNEQRPHSTLDYQTPSEFKSRWLQQNGAL
jgi:transposase InsO family protein